MSLLRKLFVPTMLTTLALVAGGCAADTEEGDEDTDSTADELAPLRPGVNSKGCRRSPYNCALNPDGNGQRVRRADDGETWAIDTKWLASHGFVDEKKQPYLPVVDGNGESMGRSKKTELVLNYGQTRRMGSTTYVMALSAGVGSAGWVPIDAFVHADSLRSRVGEVNARGASLREMACYEVKSGYDPKLDDYKVVKGATDADSQEPNDYLPQKRSGSGRVYMNLAFSVPGDALGAPAVDIFPAGTKFQRLDVPTWESPDRPSLDAALYSKPAGSARYTKKAGEMKFVYGYVKSKTGSVRYGWMALDGLAPSTGCPNR